VTLICALHCISPATNFDFCSLGRLFCVCLWRSCAARMRCLRLQCHPPPSAFVSVQSRARPQPHPRVPWLCSFAPTQVAVEFDLDAAARTQRLRSSSCGALAVSSTFTCLRQTSSRGARADSATTSPFTFILAVRFFVFPGRRWRWSSILTRRRARSACPSATTAASASPMASQPPQPLLSTRLWPTRTGGRRRGARCSRCCTRQRP
jgi:hypothetical protein